MAILPNIRIRPLALALLLAGSILWAYWPHFQEMAGKWLHNPQYSHGYLVPAFSLFLLWLRREQLKKSTLSPNWWGAVLLLVGVAVRLVGTFFFLEWLEMVSLLPILGGTALLLGGWAALRWSWPAIAFLVFMFPLPFRIE